MFNKCNYVTLNLWAEALEDIWWIFFFEELLNEALRSPIHKTCPEIFGDFGQVFSAVLHFFGFYNINIQLGFEKNLRQITAEFVNHNDLRENQIDDPNARLQAFHTQSFFATIS